MFIRIFNEITKSDVQLAGGKGASLGEMTRAGIPVPPGFVILSVAFEKFLEKTDLDVEVDSILRAVNHKEIHTVENASEKIKALILGAETPKDIADEIKKFFKKLGAEYVAVRSSATAEDSASAAWAGQLESYLNTTEENLLENVKKCWASLFTPRAIFYRFEKGLHGQHISVAVVVQKMVESEASGIAFSVHPVTEDYNQLIIEAGFGLGEAIVSGAITPDSYVVEKQPLRIADINVNAQIKALYRNIQGGNTWQALSETEGSKQVLAKGQILNLSELILKIENRYGFPVDVEWALEKGNFYIVQSRPITTLSGQTPLAKKPFYEKVFARDFCLPLIEAWCRAESTDPRQWTKRQQPKHPYIIFERTNDTVNCYMDLTGVEWIKSELTTLVAKDSKFVRSTVDNFYQRTARLKPIWDKENILGLKELKGFIRQLNDSWAWFEAVWWLIELLSGDKDNFEVLKKARVTTDGIASGSDAVIRKSLQKAFPRLGKYASFLLMEEIYSENIPSLAELQKRARGYFYTNAQLFTKRTIDDIEKEFNVRIERVSMDGIKNGFTGEIAYPGIVRGVVRRIMGREAIPSFLDGEILVSSMTTPDFLPAMQKAAAFITDEGGITCHAAIMARELQKSCIIGTKIATQVLKDGDFVEVDANNGIVRILDRRLKKDGDFKWKHINSENYDFLWKVGGSFLFASIFYPAGYSSRDFVFAHASEDYYTFVGKEERKKLAREGLRLFTGGFESYKKKVYGCLKEHKKQINKLAKRDLSSLGSEELADAFSNLVSALQIFFYNYFYTEYHLTDEVTRIIEENDNAYDIEKIKKTAEAMGRLKLKQREIMNKILYPPSILDAFTDEVSRRIPLQYPVALYKYNELVALLKKEDVSAPDRSQSVVWGKFSGDEEITGGEAKRILNQLQAVDELTTGLKGHIGNKGYYKGKVKKIEFSASTDFSAEIAAMQNGDVLVSGSTGPEMILACKKAGAIITDEGGIISHAAIVSRELGIPSVIGTRVATRLLKDGDLVEVDAERGIVKILERKAARGPELNRRAARGVVRILKKEPREVPSGKRGTDKGMVRVLGKTSSDDNSKISVLNKNRWRLGVTRNMSFFQACFDVVGHYLHSERYGVAPKKHLIVCKEGRQVYIFVDQENTKEYHRVVEEVCLSPQKLKALQEQYKKDGEVLLRVSAELEKSQNNKNFQNFVDAASHLAAGLYLTTAIGRHLSALLLERLKRRNPKASQNDLDILVGDITYPSGHTPLLESQLALLTIGAEIQRREIAVKNIVLTPDIYAKLRIYEKKYGAVPVGYTEDPWSEKQILEQLKTLLLIDCKKELDQLSGAHEERVRRAQLALKKITSPKIRQIARALQVGTFLNEYRKYVFCKASLAYRPLFKKIAARYELADWRECWKLTPDEISRLYFGKQKEVLRALERRTWTGVVFDNNVLGYRLLKQEEVAGFIPEIEGRKSEQAAGGSAKNTIGGVIANRGMVRGLARIILSSADFDKFQDGDVIVTTMTSVDFVPLMRRASAFVTNEGGITSHASIISRELNKPCIIGTKIATQVLKDGDFVEVDANNGIVKVIQKK
ncbi:MAG: hypothetical protein A2939_00690 [Parcubacteria group bacterium RIFCSPLOWO2_01_FULL_48_18]|nr:MAG: hypothetical protein A2939_00690 [Parcubacteria group bacterium RIFCSPLOWO2_01_FULL_48_18]